jgi:hypothetical protein
MNKIEGWLFDDPETEKAFLKEVVNRYKPQLHELSLATICFFTDDVKLEQRAVGSGVFIRILDSYYIVSAAHVLAEHLHDTYFVIENTAITLGGNLISSVIPDGGSRKDDKIDVTVIKIGTMALGFLLTWYTPVDISEIEVQHIKVARPKYFLNGYPLTRAGKVFGKDELTTTSYTYKTVADIEFDYQKHGFHIESHIAVAFNRHVQSPDNPYKHYGPDPTGLSGGGLWEIENGSKRLIGIIIERIKTVESKVIVCTRMEEVFRLIAVLEEKY